MPGTTLYIPVPAKAEKGVANGLASLDSSGKIPSSQINTGSIVDLIYPVGSIYMSVNNTSPETLFGGTWQALENKFLIGAGTDYTAGGTGGAASQSYTPAGGISDCTLTVDQIPSHDHSFTGSAVTSGTNSRGHTHIAPSHKHVIGAHSHGLNSHTHTWSNSHRHEGLMDSSHTYYFSMNGNGNTTGYYPASGTAAGPIWTTGIHTVSTSISGTTSGPSKSQTENNASFYSGDWGGGANDNTGGESQNHTHSVTASGTIGSKGGSKAHGHSFTGTPATINTIPPYLAVYMWKRTA